MPGRGILFTVIKTCDTADIGATACITDRRRNNSTVGAPSHCNAARSHIRATENTAYAFRTADRSSVCAVSNFQRSGSCNNTANDTACPMLFGGVNYIPGIRNIAPVRAVADDCRICDLSDQSADIAAGRRHISFNNQIFNSRGNSTVLRDAPEQCTVSGAI